MTHEDPGWRPASTGLWWYFVPFLGAFMRIKAQHRETDGLLRLRRTFLSLLPSLAFFFIAFSFLEPFDGGNEEWFPALVALVGLVSLAGAVWIRGRALDTTSPAALAGSYRAVCVLGIGIAEMAALCGTAAALLSGSSWLYLIGAAFTLVGLWLVAPTAHDIERRQRAIIAKGSTLSLLDALSGTPPPGQSGGTPRT